MHSQGLTTTFIFKKILLYLKFLFSKLKLQAIFGCDITFNTLEGESFEKKLSAGIQTNEAIVIKNKGMYIIDEKVNNSNKRGDLIINFNIKIPNGNIMAKQNKDKLRGIINSLEAIQ